MTSDMEIEDYFMRKLNESAVLNNGSLPLQSQHLKGYVSDGRQSGIACNKFPAGIDQFTKPRLSTADQYTTGDQLYETKVKGLRQ